MSAPNHHSVNDTFTLTHTIVSDIATVYFYNDNILVVEVKRGVSLSYKTGGKLFIQVVSYLKFTPFVYISNRIHSYSTVPTDYKYLDRVPTLRALSILRHPSEFMRPEPVEVIFCKKEFKLHHNLLEALYWAKNVLDTH